MGFRFRLYFMRIWPELIETSRRVKFQSKIELVNPIGSGSGIVVVLGNQSARKQKKIIILTQ
jgi:hypothetical protein